MSADNQTYERPALQRLALASCPRCQSRLDRPGVIPDGPMPEDFGGPCSDPYGVHAAFTELRDGLAALAGPPTGDEDALDLLQELWATAGRLVGSDA